MLCDFSGRRVRGTGVSLSARKVWPTKQRSSRATLVAHRGLRHYSTIFLFTLLGCDIISPAPELEYRGVTRVGISRRYQSWNFEPLQNVEPLPELESRGVTSVGISRRYKSWNSEPLCELKYRAVTTQSTPPPKARLYDAAKGSTPLRTLGIQGPFLSPNSPKYSFASRGGVTKVEILRRYKR